MVFHVVLFCRALSPLASHPAASPLSPPPHPLRFSLSLVKLIPTAEPGEPPASRDDSAMSSERVPSDGQKIAEREILLPRTASFYLARDLTSVIISIRAHRLDIVSGSRLYLCTNVVLIIYCTMRSSRYSSSAVCKCDTISPGGWIKSLCRIPHYKSIIS